MPLIRNPAYQPPRAVTLNTNYGKLLANLPGSALPPPPKVQPQELEDWKRDLEQLRDRAQNSDAASKYAEWLALQQRKVAPGFTFDVMEPLKGTGP